MGDVVMVRCVRMACAVVPKAGLESVTLYLESSGSGDEDLDNPRTFFLVKWRD